MEEKLELFCEQPILDLYEGVQVNKDTRKEFKNDTVEQQLKDLKLETIITESGSNGINNYDRKTYLKINLNAGDILLFNEKKGFYLPTYPVSTIDDAISDINSLKNIKGE